MHHKAKKKKQCISHGSRCARSLPLQEHMASVSGVFQVVILHGSLVKFVEVPDTCQGLYYCNILSGVVRGALEMGIRNYMKQLCSYARDCFFCVTFSSLF